METHNSFRMEEQIKKVKIKQTSHGIICENIEKCWQNFRKLFHRNDSLFEVIFILTYFFEQLGLVYFTFKFRDTIELLPYIISFFSLFLLTTVGINRLLMESKNKFIREQHEELYVNFHMLENHYKLMKKEYEGQIELLEDVFNENESLRKKTESLKKKAK